MIIPAILRKNEVIQEFKKMQYTDELMYEVGNLNNWMPNIAEEPDKETYQYAVVNSSSELIGYISYKIDWYSSQAHSFCIMSFDKGNPLMGKEVFGILTNILEVFKIHRLEWCMLGGNPVQRSYDRFCKKYNGTKHVLRDVMKDRMGVYHDSMIYEIVQDK